MFQVTKDGRVFLNGKEKKQSNHSAGYKVVSKNTKLYYVHRLVCETYIPNPDNLPQVNHKNGIKNDNRVENLEWVSINGNRQHAIDNKLWGKNIIDKRKLTDEEAEFIRTLYSNKQFNQTQLASMYKVNQRTIFNIVHNKHYVKKKEDYVSM